MSGRTPIKRGGFSIVELMVVLAIIAIVIAILLPSLSLAREQANRTRCLNNLRQVGISLHIYLNDYKDYPISGATAVAPSDTSPDDSGPPPLYYSEPRGGLLALQPNTGAVRESFACPDGWASGGDTVYYYSRGLNRAGAAYMDYAYWPWRYPKPPDGKYSVTYASFQYRREKGTKILVSDIVSDLADASANTIRVIGYGNHSTYITSASVVSRTDGTGKPAKGVNRIHSTGSSVLFSDYHCDWFDARRLTQQANGICYPPADQW